MRLVFRVYVLAMLSFLSFTTAAELTIIECPATQLEFSEVDFDSEHCNKSTLRTYSMSVKSVWVLMSLPISEDLLNSQKPIGLFMSGRSSATVYINGIKIGEKGVPSLAAEQEIAGALDWVGYVPRATLNKTPNYISMHLSSFQNQWPTIYPFSDIYFGVYEPSTSGYLKHYLPTLIPLGAMLLSLIYLLRRIFLEPKAANLAYLLILTLAATLQLVAEVFRGFYAYQYPFHDMRLTIIYSFAFVFGQVLLAQTLNQFTQIKKNSSRINFRRISRGFAIHN